MNTWVVDPSEQWLSDNIRWTIEANVLVERCPATLMGAQCILVEEHHCSHAVQSDTQPGTTEE
jgi:hypothetical protein